MPATPTETPAGELSAEQVAVALRFLAHYEAGEYEELVALMAPGLREQPFGPITAAQFWTFNSQFHTAPDVPTACEANGSKVACDWRGQDDVSRELGYQLKTEWSFTIEEGLITRIDHSANDDGVFGPLSGYVQATYPDELGCASDHSDEPEYEPGALTGSDGSAFAQHCAAKMAKYAAEFGETDALSVWDADSGTPLLSDIAIDDRRQLDSAGRLGLAPTLSVAPDSGLVAAVSAVNPEVVEVWSLDPVAWIDLACKAARPLTSDERSAVGLADSYGPCT